VRKLQEKTKGAVYRLDGAGIDGSAIVAKRSSPARILQERAVYEQILPALDVPTVRYFGFVEELGAACCWIFVDDAGDGMYASSDAEHRSLAARWLARLHTAGARCRPAAQLPDRGPAFYLAQLRAACDTIGRYATNAALTSDDTAVLRAIVRHCEVAAARWPEVERLCERTPRTFVHGDFAPKNVRLRNDQRSTDLALIAFDWGSAGWGSIAADLVQWSESDGRGTFERWNYWAHPDLATYSGAVRHLWPELDVELLRHLATIGKLFRCLVCIALSAQSFATPWIERAACNMRIYEAEMVDALRGAGWAVGDAR
jgi:hypothetical protein